ncbi:putative GPI transamidase subunit PIG-U [Helianthus debilis subsp. tardiflorus]
MYYICFNQDCIYRYFFAEVFDFFRDFFLIVFHINILFMVLPLAIRLHHRPCFLAFVYLAISSILKSYPSVYSLESDHLLFHILIPF